MQLRVWHIARSVLSNWFTTAASLAVGFFLSPFIVHRLGNVAYGVWILAISSINYLIILDLGLASSVVRFVSKGHTTGDHQSSSDALSAVLWVRLQIGAIIFALSCALALLFPILFKIPPELAIEARKALLVIGVTTTISMSFGVFSSVLSALNRYDLRSYVTLVQLLIRVVGVVSVLSAGMGIVAIAVCELLSAAVGSALLVLVVRRVYPELKLSLKRPARAVLRKIWSYSFYAFLITVAMQLVYQTDNLVVGAFVSAAAVTFYSIGNSLCRYTQQIVSAMTTTFTPAASTFEAAGQMDRLRSLYYNGTRTTMALSLPILITLLTRGQTFIGIWMGAQYARSSGIVLAILATALLFSLPNSTANSIAWGVEKHKETVKWAIGEAVGNLALSVILAHWYGIYGVALGTLIPSLIVNIGLWPSFVSRFVDVTWIQVFRDVWGPMFACSVPFAIASFAVDVYFPTHSLALFSLQTISLLPVFGLTTGLLYRDKIRHQIFPRFKSLLLANSKFWAN